MHDRSSTTARARKLGRLTRHCRITPRRQRLRWGSGLAALAIALGLPGSVHAIEWPQWGGPNRNFTLPAGQSAWSWPENGPALVWERPLGQGYATVLADGARLYTMTRRGDQEVVIAINATDGSTVWEYAFDSKVPDTPALDTSWGAGPATTPLLADGHLYVLGFLGQLHCLQATDGKPVWKQDLRSRHGAAPPYFGIAASPIRHDDLVIVLAGGARAFDLHSGELRWSNTEFESSYASPALFRREGQTHLIGAVAGEAVGLDPSDGRLLWRVDHANSFRTILTSPLVGEDWIFVSSYQRGTSGLQFDPETSLFKLGWEEPKPAISYMNATPHGDLVYGFSGSILTAVDMRSGEIAWRHRGLKEGNLVRRGDQLLHLGERGTLSLLQLGDAGVQLLGQTAVLSGRSWSAPTVVGPRVYVRNQEVLRAFDLSRSASTAAVQPSTSFRTPMATMHPDKAKAFLNYKTRLSQAMHRADAAALAASRQEMADWATHPTVAHLAEYYVALALWQQTMLAPRSDQPALLDSAVEAAKRSIAAQPQFADAHALLGTLYPLYYRINPQRGAVVGLLGEDHRATALELDPGNPRTVAFDGLRFISRPPEHGGDRAAGLAQLRDALKLFAEAPQENSGLDPDWGHAQALTWYAEALSEGDVAEKAEARRSLEQAVKLVPESREAGRLLEAMGDGR